MFRPLLFVCLAVGFSNSALAEDPIENLEKAKKAYSEAVEKAKHALVEGFATAIKTATGSGNLDVVKALQAEKEAFEGSGKLPSSARMKPALTAYHTSLKQAMATIEKAYDQTIKDLTKAMKFSEAEAVQTQRKEFHAKGGSNLRPADVIAKEDLQKYLVGTSWEWDDGMTLKADGYVTQKNWDGRGLVTKWEAVDRRTVVLFIEKGRTQDRTATLVFNEDLTDLSGYSFDGTRITSMKRKP
jgi:hypothetical protein